MLNTNIKLYNLVQKEDGSVTVQTDLSPEDMLTLLTIGFYACYEKGVMVKSLADKYFQNPEEVNITQEGSDPIDYNEYLDDFVAKKEES